VAFLDKLLTWQGPEFYKRLGYTLYGKLDNLPKGSHLSYFKKNLNKTNPHPPQKQTSGKI
jgi:hypothetical protein